MPIARRPVHVGLLQKNMEWFGNEFQDPQIGLAKIAIGFVVKVSQ